MGNGNGVMNDRLWSMMVMAIGMVNCGDCWQRVRPSRMRRVVPAGGFSMWLHKALIGAALLLFWSCLQIKANAMR